MAAGVSIYRFMLNLTRVYLDYFVGNSMECLLQCFFKWTRIGVSPQSHPLGTPTDAAFSFSWNSIQVFLVAISKTYSAGGCCCHVLLLREDVSGGTSSCEYDFCW